MAHFSVITKKRDLGSAQRRLQERVRGEGEPRWINVGYQGGSFPVMASYVQRLDLWYAPRREHNRWWNGFGLGEPVGTSPMSIVAEVNPTFDGSRRAAGAFLRDGKGQVWLAHSGRIGGGKKGVGRTAFLDAFSGTVQEVEGHDYVIIGRIDARNFPDRLVAFVRAVQAFKADSGRSIASATARAAVLRAGQVDNQDALKVVIARERIRREQIWRALRKAGGPVGVAPSLVKQLGIRGQHGVFRDLIVTRGLTGMGTGVALSIRHTGSVYADDLSEDHILYHYPSTRRGRRRDAGEIEAMKACGSLGLPLFVVITPTRGSRVRDVRRGWVVDHDDDLQMTLISFEEADYEPSDADDIDSLEFHLKGRGKFGRTWAKTRPGQGAFRFRVLRRYGRRCAFCDIDHDGLLHAAHLCPVEAGGSDDPRNGLVLCLNHHRAFDLGLLRIDPETLDVVAVSPPSRTGRVRKSIRHLSRHPADDALRWAWKNSEPD